MDCRGVSTVPCLRVTVNLTGSNQTALLHLDEELVLHALEVQILGTEIHISYKRKKKKTRTHTLVKKLCSPHEWRRNCTNRSQERRFWVQRNKVPSNEDINTM